MTSFLIISSQADLALAEAESICEQHTISHHDITLFDPSNSDGKTPKKSWGIGDIRQMQKVVYLKPHRGSTKAVIVKEADLLTQEAQNALLKVLEEPPAGTLLFLLGPSLDNFLPTVVSRCKVITLTQEEVFSQEEKERIKTDLSYLKDASISDRLKKAELLSKNKEDAVKWLTAALFAKHEEFQLDPTQHVVNTIKQLSLTHKVVKTTNTNLRLALENLFLSIP